MRYLLLLLLPFLLYSAQVENLRWPKGETYLEFLERLELPNKLYYNLDKEDQRMTEEIRSGVHYQVLRDGNQSIEQVLIPISDELQIHIMRDEDHYNFEMLPIIYDRKREEFSLKIQNSPYYDIMKATSSTRIAQLFVGGFKNSLNFRRDLRKGDPMAMVYEQKYRMGKPFSQPRLLAAMIEMRGKKHYVYLNEDERYYDENGHEVEGFLLARPVKGARISSGFTKRRYHPILKRYRAHLGVDYAAPRGTPIMAAGSGKVIFKGYTRGYGNLTKIAHSDGYVTLYAHQKAFRRGIHRGSYVKKGRVIGYIGTTGLSTGPHLHFGLYKNGHAINPARVVRVTTKKLKGKAKKRFLEIAKEYNSELDAILTKGAPFKKSNKFDDIYYIVLQNKTVT